MFSRSSTDQIMQRLELAQIANARVNEVRDVWEHPQLKARGRWAEIETPVGKVPSLLPPGTPEAYTPRMDPVPALGEHTDKILEELGYDEREIRNLRSENVV